MSIKGAFKTLSVLVFLLTAQWWVQSHYNGETVYYEIGPIAKATSVEELQDWLPGLTLNWELQTADYNLIMTTGNDQLHKKITGVDKPWVSPANQEAVLSAKVADRLFKTTDVASKSLRIMDQPYIVSRVIKEGNNIYIPYNPDLLSKPWSRVRLYYTASSYQQAEIDDARYNNLISLLKFDVYHKGYAKGDVYLFYNLALLTLLYVLRSAGISLIGHYNVQKFNLEEKYKGYKPFYSFKTFIKQEYKDCLSFMLSHLALLGFLVVGVKLLSNLILPTTLFPTNWFSLSSYNEILTQLRENFQYKMQFGFSDLSQTVIYLFLLFTVYLFTLRKLKNTTPKL